MTGDLITTLHTQTVFSQSFEHFDFAGTEPGPAAKQASTQSITSLPIGLYALSDIGSAPWRSLRLLF